MDLERAMGSSNGALILTPKSSIKAGGTKTNSMDWVSISMKEEN
jgi:hypothetical protein